MARYCCRTESEESRTAIFLVLLFAGALWLSSSLVENPESAAASFVANAYTSTTLWTSGASAFSGAAYYDVSTGLPRHRPDFDVFVINMDSNPKQWKEAQGIWRRRFPQLRRFPATSFKGKRTNRQGLNTSIMRALLTLLNNTHPFVIIMEDDAVPTPAFDALWPRVVAELLARTDEWDIIHTGARFKGISASPQFAAVKCSRMFLEVDKAFAAQMIIYNRSVLRLGAEWIYALLSGLDVMANDVYFTTNGPSALKKQYGGSGYKSPGDAMFRMWHPRDSLTTQSTHVSATQGGILNITREFEGHAQHIRNASALLLPSLYDVKTPDMRLLNCPIIQGG